MISENRKRMMKEFIRDRVYQSLVKHSTVITNNDGDKFMMMTENEYLKITFDAMEATGEYLSYDFDWSI